MFYIVSFLFHIVSFCFYSFLPPPPKKKKKKKKKKKGEWTSETSGGCRNFPTWVNNPQFGIRCPEGQKEAHIFVTLQQKDEDLSEVGMYIFAMNDAASKVDENAELLTKSKFQSPLSSSLELTVRPGKPIIVLPCTFDPDMPANFDLTVSSSCKIELFEIGGDSESVVSIDGEWDSATSGGCFNHPTWRQNKQYLMYVHQPTTLKVKVSCHLSSGRNPFSIGAYVLSPSSEGEKEEENYSSLERIFVTPSDVVARSPFAPHSSVSTETFEAEPSPNPYIIIPCSFHPQNHSTFSLSVENVNSGSLEGVVELKEAEKWGYGKVEGEWGEGGAGGSFAHSSWRENPQYRVRVKDGARVCLRLRRSRVIFFFFFFLKLFIDF